MRLPDLHINGETMRFAIAAGVIAASLVAAVAATAAEKVTFLLPGPENLPAFVQFQLARSKGYFAEEQLDVAFIAAKGGVDVAKQVAVGNGDIGTALADTVILLRPNGVPVKAVAQLGKGGLNQLIARDDSGIKSLADLRGKKIGVGSFSQSSYYELLAVLAHYDIPKSALDIEAGGPGGVAKMLMTGALDAIVNPPEWALEIRGNGIAVHLLPIEDVFPAMPQALLASDDVIARRPAMVGGIVKAMLHSLRDIVQSPQQAAVDYVRGMPQYVGQERRFQEILEMYVADVYVMGMPGRAGAFDSARFTAVQEFYLKNDVIRTTTRVEDLFTNQFVPAE